VRLLHRLLLVRVSLPLAIVLALLLLVPLLQLLSLLSCLSRGLLLLLCHDALEVCPYSFLQPHHSTRFRLAIAMLKPLLTHDCHAQARCVWHELVCGSGTTTAGAATPIRIIPVCS
jgi:hypothetical protein